jgi:hypothetical protein
VVWTHHHIILDGWSSPILLSEIRTLYDAALRGERLELLELPDAPLADRDLEGGIETDKGLVPKRCPVEAILPIDVAVGRVVARDQELDRDLRGLRDSVVFSILATEWPAVRQGLKKRIERG